MRMVLLIAVLTLSAPPTKAEIICGDRDVVLQVFEDDYGPWQITSTHRQQNTTVEILNAPSTRTWAVMGENYRRQICITTRQTDRPEQERREPLPMT